MINSKDLRLENWVYNTHNIPMVVKTIGMDYIYVDFKNNPGDLLEFNTYNPFKPITLTEEILLKIKGIEKHKSIKDRYVLKDSPYSFHIEDGFWNEPSLDIMKNGMYIICVEHLHELQNTMFWLLKEELTVTL